MPTMPAAFVQGQTESQSTTPGVATSSRPKAQLAIIAGFMMKRRSFISMVWKSASVSVPDPTFSTW